MKTLTLTLAAATMGVASLSAPAFAGKSDRQTEAVSAKGLDLNTAEGQEMLERRVEAAARRVCGYKDYSRQTTLKMKLTSRDCLTQARASAKEQVAALIEDQRRGG